MTSIGRSIVQAVQTREIRGFPVHPEAAYDEIGYVSAK
jgi:hypothetical protein